MNSWKMPISVVKMWCWHYFLWSLFVASTSIYMILNREIVKMAILWRENMKCTIYFLWKHEFGTLLSSQISWWCLVLGVLSTLIALCADNSLLLVDSPHKGPVMCSLMFSLLLAWASCWTHDLSCWWFEIPWCWCNISVMFVVNEKPC